MRKKIIFATNNAHKLREVRQILGSAFEVLSLGDVGCHDDIPETGATLEENALIKARWLKSHTGLDCFADDTGLEVDALGGAPGVHSARYAAERGGADHDGAANMSRLLSELAGVGEPGRTARFRTVMALVTDARGEQLAQGVVEGKILAAPRGEGGFGYDPVFVPEGFSQSFAEMTEAQKNAVSHRRRAADALLRLLEGRP